MERVALEVSVLGRRAVLGRLVIQGGDAFEHRDHVLRPGPAQLHRLRVEQPTPQDLGHVVFLHRLDRLLALTLEDVVQVGDDLLAQRVGLVLRFARQQRRHGAALLHLRRRLRQVLEEADQNVEEAGLGVATDLGVQ